MRLDRLLGAAQADMDHWDRVREELLARSRELVRASGDLIRSLHRGERSPAKWKAADVLARRLLRTIKTEREFRRSGFVQQGLGEYAEALILRASLDTAFEPKTLAELPGDAVLLGIADTIGELRRNCLDRLLQGDPKGAEKSLTRMESLFELLAHADAPEPLVSLRPKRDAARGILERTRGDVVNARKTKELERKIDNLGSLLDEAEGTAPKKRKKVDDDELDVDGAWNH
jgi:translin